MKSVINTKAGHVIFNSRNAARKYTVTIKGVDRTYSTLEAAVEALETHKNKLLKTAEEIQNSIAKISS